MPLDCGTGFAVNSSAFNSHFTELCVCPDVSKWSGANDYFDSRVQTYMGVTYSVGCTNSTIGTYVAYGVLLFVCTFKFVTIWVAFFDRTRRKGVKKMSELYTVFPYRILIFDGLFCMPWHLCLCILKLSNPEGHVIGTNIGITVVLVIAVSISIFSATLFNIDEFTTLVKSERMTTGSGAGGSKILKLYAFLMWMVFFSYFVITGIPRYVMLSLDRSLGPYQNGQWIWVIIGNMGVLCWMIFHFFTTTFTIKQTGELLRGIDANEQATARVAEVIKFLKAAETQNRKAIVFGFILYTIGSVPFFWVYQQYILVIALAMAHFSGNVGMIYLRSRNAQTKAASSSVGELKSPKTNTGNTASIRADKTQVTVHQSSFTAANEPSFTS